jgi:hypothetical protein
MKTLTHLAVGYLLGRVACARGRQLRAFLCGAVIPDIPVMMVGIYVWFGGGTGLEFSARMASIYFEDPLLIIAHSLLHAPLSLFGASVCMLRTCLGGRALTSALYLFAGTLIHTTLDLLTHHDDGPLLLWPLDWETRYLSPVSHWDKQHYAIWVVAFEGFIVGVALMLALSRPRSLKVHASLG